MALHIEDFLEKPQLPIQITNQFVDNNYYPATNLILGSHEFKTGTDLIRPPKIGDKYFIPEDDKSERYIRRSGYGIVEGYRLLILQGNKETLEGEKKIHKNLYAYLVTFNELFSVAVAWGYYGFPGEKKQKELEKECHRRALISRRI